LIVPNKKNFFFIWPIHQMIRKMTIILEQIKWHVFDFIYHKWEGKWNDWDMLMISVFIEIWGRIMPFIRVVMITWEWKLPNCLKNVSKQ
jgi:hypothetical protein